MEFCKSRYYLQELLATATSAEKQMDSILRLVKQNPSEHTLLQSVTNDLRAEKTAGIVSYCTSNYNH